MIKGNLVLDKSLSAAVVGFENVQVLGSVYLYGTDGCRYSMKNVSAANVTGLTAESGGAGCASSTTAGAGTIAPLRIT